MLQPLFRLNNKCKHSIRMTRKIKKDSPSKTIQVTNSGKDKLLAI